MSRPRLPLPGGHPLHSPGHRVVHPFSGSIADRARLLTVRSADVLRSLGWRVEAATHVDAEEYPPRFVRW